MASAKKKLKRVATLSSPPAFNKKNVLELADWIHSSENARVSYAKLCSHALAVKTDKHTIQCGIGEAYSLFVSPDIFHLLNKFEDGEEATDAACNALISVAEFKRGTNRVRLLKALRSVIDANDMDELDFNSENENRARRVAEAFRKEVAPLLK